VVSGMSWLVFKYKPRICVRALLLFCISRGNVVLLCILLISFISVGHCEVTRGVHCVAAAHPAVGLDAVPEGVFRHYRQVGTTLLVVLTCSILSTDAL